MALSLADRIAAANTEALRRMEAVSPVLVRVRPAREVFPVLSSGRVLLHAGPPVAAGALCGPMHGAMIGAHLYERWSRTAEEAERALVDDRVSLLSAHDHGAVGPMAGVISPSMPVLVVQGDAAAVPACAPLNEGIGAVLRFGAYTDAVIERLRWMQEVLGPALDAALVRLGGIPLIPLMAQALTMGDEMHQRNVAATSLFLRAVAPALAEASPPHAGSVLRFLAQTDQSFLNVAMAAAKAIMTAAADIPSCTVVTAMSRNGVTFGLRVSGLGDGWFIAPAPVPEGLYFPGFGAADANQDMGDSAILETVGLGAFSMAAAPAVVGFVGLGGAAQAIQVTRVMGEITVGQSAHFKIPALDFAGAPTGIDIRKVVRLETRPLINTGIAHREAGVGQIGAGVARAPLECFEQALAEFGRRYVVGAPMRGGI